MHTEECLEYQRKSESARQAWLEKWPNTCKQCDGFGVLAYTEHYGDGLGSQQLDEPCDCVSAGRCPRCGYQHGAVNDKGELVVENAESVAFLEDAHPCFGCGWDWEDLGAPPAFDGCGCGSIEIEYTLPEKLSEDDMPF